MSDEIIAPEKKAKPAKSGKRKVRYAAEYHALRGRVDMALVALGKVKEPSDMVLFAAEILRDEPKE